jgi:hypothetical protein
MVRKSAYALANREIFFNILFMSLILSETEWQQAAIEKV